VTEFERSRRVSVSLSLPTSLRAWDSGIFEDLKCLFSTTLEVGEETEANGGHRGDRTLNRTWSRFDQTHPVSSTQQSSARVLGFATGASGPSWNRSIRSGTQRSSTWRRANRTRGTSGHMRLDAPVIKGALWNLSGPRPDVGTVASDRCMCASGQCFAGARRCTLGASGRLSGASGRCI
jgi:hypothetical protein